MHVYVDTSVLLRVTLGERGRLKAWSRIEHAYASELVRTEALRTIDRARISGLLRDEEVADRREAVAEQLRGFVLVGLDRRILRRAAEPLPTTLGALDAIHLVSAVALRGKIPELRFATHDAPLAVAARAVGFSLVT